ncbi:MAG TPA: hypothetical protein ENK18_05755 [Deltaproteobacteria bacterium]|nr:hypothetical protein [Deltaproteobacteria bacterium]
MVSRWSVVIAWGAGCVPPEGLATFGEVDGTDLLVGSPASAFPERVRLRSGARARLLPDGALLPGAPVSPGRRPLDPLVVVDPGPRPRIALTSWDVQVLLYLDRGDLQPYVVGTGVGSGASGQGRVQLEPGTPVEILERSTDRILVGLEEPGLELRAWFPSGVADEVYRDEELQTQLRLEEPEGTAMYLLGDTEVLDSPHGEPLLWARGDPDRPWGAVVVTGEPVRGFRPIVLERSSLYVEGWAHVDDLRFDAGYDFGSLGLPRRSSSIRCGGVVGLPPACAIVPEGTLLRTEPDGPVVGQTLGVIQVSRDAWFEGVSLIRQTQLGMVQLWVGPEDVVDLEVDRPHCR